MTNSEYASALRRIADIYDANPWINQPYEGISMAMSVYCHSKSEMAAAVKAFGTGKKSDGHSTVDFEPDITKPILLKIQGFKSDCCERVVVGVKEVPEQVYPATKKYVVPAHTEEIVEWRCSPVLQGVDSEEDQ